MPRYRRENRAMHFAIAAKPMSDVLHITYNNTDLIFKVSEEIPHLTYVMLVIVCWLINLLKGN